MAPEEFFWFVNIRYTLGQYSTPSARYLVVFVSPAAISGIEEANVRRISVLGQPAELILDRGNKGSVFLQWRQDWLNYSVSGQLDADFQLSNLMTIVRSIR